MNPVANALARHLGDLRNAEPAASFPLDPSRASHPGLYSWWADAAGLAMLSEPFGGALSSRSGGQVNLARRHGLGHSGVKPG